MARREHRRQFIRRRASGHRQCVRKRRCQHCGTQFTEAVVRQREEGHWGPESTYDASRGGGIHRSPWRRDHSRPTVYKTLVFHQVFCPGCNQIVEEVLEQGLVAKFFSQINTLLVSGVFVFGIWFILRLFDVGAATSIAVLFFTLICLYWFVLRRRFDSKL